MQKGDVFLCQLVKTSNSQDKKKLPERSFFYYFKTAFKKNPAKPLHNAVIIDVTIKL